MRLLLALSVVLGAGSAAACTCRIITGKPAIAAADLIVRGRVTAAHRGDRIKGPGRFEIEVDRVWKGPAKRRMTVSIGSLCPIGLPTVGTRWIYFLYGDPKSGWTAPPCAGSEDLDRPMPPSGLAALFGDDAPVESIFDVLGPGRPVPAR